MTVTDGIFLKKYMSPHPQKNHLNTRLDTGACIHQPSVSLDQSIKIVSTQNDVS